jgi:hypothetical protein
MENISDDILDIGETVFVNESIESFQYSEYDPQNPLGINTVGQIRIDIQGYDSYTLPSKSYLLVEGKLAAAAADYAEGDKVTLINNAIPYMFSQIKYNINDNTIEDVTSPGQATTMKGMLMRDNNFVKGLNMCWAKDTDATATSANAGFESRRQLIIVGPTPNGSFSFYIPLSHIFGFCADYTKVIYGVKHSLLLSRKSDDDAIFRADAVGAGKITLSKLQWCMPHVAPSLEYQNILTKQIEKKIKLPVLFRSNQCNSLAVPQATSFSWRLGSNTSAGRPRWIIVGFQTGRDGDQKKNPALFDNVKVSDIHAMLNNIRYPNTEKALDFTAFKTSRAYEAFCNFKDEYYGKNESSTQITSIEFIKLFPLFVIDVRRQPERLKTTTLDIQIKVKFNENVPANTTAYALMISDTLLYLESDGNKFHTAY